MMSFIMKSKLQPKICQLKKENTYLRTIFAFVRKKIKVQFTVINSSAGK